MLNIGPYARHLCRHHVLLEPYDVSDLIVLIYRRGSALRLEMFRRLSEATQWLVVGQDYNPGLCESGTHGV